MSDNIDTARTFLSENRLRMTLSADGGRPWYVVKGADGSLDCTQAADGSGSCHGSDGRTMTWTRESRDMAAKQ